MKVKVLGGKIAVAGCLVFLCELVSAKPWWQNPVLKYDEELTNISGSVDPHYMNKDESDQYLAMVTGSGGGTLFLYSIPSLITGPSSDDVTPIAQANTSDYWGTAWKGVAVSDDLKRVLTGQTGTQPDHTSYPVYSPWLKDANTFTVTNDSTLVYFDGCDFSHTSQYLFSDVYKSDEPTIPRRSVIVKWNVTNLLGNGIGLVTNTTAATSITRIRNVSSYYIGGKDLVYYGEGDTAAAGICKICVYDFDTATETTLISDLPALSSDTDVMNVKIGGVGLGDQMHLYVQCNDGALYIYNLAENGKSISSMVKSFTASEMKSIVGESFSRLRNFEFTNDEKYAFFLHAPTATTVNLHVVWAPPAKTLWWNNPSIKFGKDTGVSANVDPHYMNKDEADCYLFVPLASANVNTPGQLYSIPELISASEDENAQPIAAGTPASLYGNWKGGAVSDDLLRIVPGNGVPLSTTHFASLPLTDPWTQGVTVYDITNNPSAWGIDGVDFSHTSEFLFSDVYNSGYRNLIVKWNVVNLNETGLGLTTNTIFTTSLSRIRNVSAAYIEGKDLIYYGEGDDKLGITTRKVCVYDPELGTETELVTLDRTGESGVIASDLDVMNVKVGSIGLGRQMHLYVQCNDGTLYIYNLSDDGKSLTGLARMFTVSEMKTLLVGSPTVTLGSSDRIRCLEFTNDENFAFFIHKPNTGNAILNVVWTQGGTVMRLQ